MISKLFGRNSRRELESQLEEALLSKDRFADHVSELEEKIDHQDEILSDCFGIRKVEKLIEDDGTVIWKIVRQATMGAECTYNLLASYAIWMQDVCSKRDMAGVTIEDSVKEFMENNGYAIQR